MSVHSEPVLLSQKLPPALELMNRSLLLSSLYPIATVR